MLTPENKNLLKTLISQNVNQRDGKPFAVYYQTKFGTGSDAAYNAYDGKDVTVNLAGYTKLADVWCQDLENVFALMQGDLWSPQGEARPIIRGLGLQHTSMSVGDLVRDENGEFFICAMISFKKVQISE